jgi:hypothetical protein
MPLNDDFVTDLLDTKVYDRMKNMFHIATSVTPLVAISTNKWANMSASRDQFISVSFFMNRFSFNLTSITRQQLSMEIRGQRCWQQWRGTYGNASFGSILGQVRW